jgi:hypothetical protein
LDEDGKYLKEPVHLAQLTKHAKISKCGILGVCVEARIQGVMNTCAEISLNFGLRDFSKAPFIYWF